MKGPNGRLQAFGFCDYANAESALRAIRLLHDYEIAEKKLVVKVDAKTKEKLDNYAKESEESKSKAAEEAKSKDGDDESKSAEDESKPAEDESKEEDERVMELVRNLVKDAEAHIKSKKSEAQNNESSANESAAVQAPSEPKKQQIPAEPNLQSFSDMDIEDEKKTLIHREIGKFRSTYKKQDEEKEKLEAERARERELRRERDRRDRDRERSRMSPSRDRKLEVLSGRYDRESSSRYDSRSDRLLDRPDRNNDYRSLDRDRDRGDRDRIDRDRDRNDRDRIDRDRIDRDRLDRDRLDRDRLDRDRNDRDRSDRDRLDRLERDRNDRDRESNRSNYEDDETIELRRQQREERKKEQSYQKRLKDWESREERKRRQYEKDKYRAIERKKEEEKELLNLKQFLEDYNDDLDDVKYYKGSNFQRKLREFEKEREEDERDRISEKKELEELRKKLADEGHPDPENEAKKLMSNDEPVVEKPAELNNGNHRSAEPEAAAPSEEIHMKSFSLTKQEHRHLKSQGNEDTTHITPVSEFPNNHTAAAGATNEKKKKSLSMQEVFNENEDEEKSQATKKRKLPVFIDDNTDSNQSLTSNNKNSNDSKSLSTDDKRKQIKAVIDSIPTTKEELFKYEIEWDFVDSNLMEKRIRPWINKKITEYIGEEEKALLDFICGKLNARCNAQSILDDVAMVLDDEAEVFIVKMLRLLIYEIEAKKLGLGGK